MLVNKQLQEQLEGSGYATLDLLDANQVSSLLKLYKKEKPLFNKRHTYCNIFSANYKKNVRIENKIREIINSVITKNFEDITLIGGCFLVKKNFGDNKVALHQDWKITDEEQFQSYNIWIPLVDVNKENGTLMFLNKSHSYFNNAVRSYNIPSEYIDIEDKLNLYCTSVNLKAGQALIYSSSLFHGSYPNKSKSERPVVILSCCDKKANLYYYYYNSKDDITYKLERPIDFHLKYQKSIETTILNGRLKVISKQDGKPPNFTYDDIYKRYNP